MKYKEIRQYRDSFINEMLEFIEKSTDMWTNRVETKPKPEDRLKD